MKNNIGFLICFIFLFTSISKTFAYSNEYFSLSMPNDYIFIDKHIIDDELKKAGVSESFYKNVIKYQWKDVKTNNSFNVVITKSKNTSPITDLEEAEMVRIIDNNQNNLTIELKKILGDDTTIKPLDYKIEKFGKYNSFKFINEINSLVSSYLQHTYIIITKNYIITLTFTDQILTDNDLDLTQIKNSFIINDEIPLSNNQKYSIFEIGLYSVSILFIFIGLYHKYKTKK